MIRRPPRSTLSSSSAASDVYKRQRLIAAFDYRSVLTEVACTEICIEPFYKRTYRALPCYAFKITKRLRQFVQFHIVHKTLIDRGVLISLSAVSPDFCAQFLWT